MRKSDLYMPGLYIDYAGKYYERREWKEKWKRRLRTAALLTLVLVAGVFSAGRLGSRFMEFMAAKDTSSLSTLSSGLSGTACMDEMKEYIENTVVIEGEKKTGYLGDAIGKAPEETLIVLDPGHGGEDEGCSRGGVQEKDINLNIALAAQARLQEMGYQVLLTRNADIALTLEERVQTANAAGADLYISIHQNASEETKAEGMEVWYSAQNEGAGSERLSRLIQKFAVQDTGAAGREIVETEELYVIRECTMPSCLVETGFLSNAAERKKLASPEYQEQLADGIVSGIDLYFHPKTMYLTFDDGPSAENTSAVLDTLKERNIKATFFVVGENVEKHPEVARRIVEEGHTLGIHCYSHEYRELYASADSYVEDFEKAQRIVKEVTGVEAKLFRFPGGSINSYNKQVYQEIIEEMTEKGYIYYDWNASLEDAVQKADPETLIQNAVSSTLGRKKVVMLAHDVVYQTTQCLDKLLDQFPEYQMEPLTEEVAPIQF